MDFGWDSTELNPENRLGTSCPGGAHPRWVLPDSVYGLRQRAAGAILNHHFPAQNLTDVVTVGPRSLSPDSRADGGFRSGREPSHPGGRSGSAAPLCRCLVPEKHSGRGAVKLRRMWSFSPVPQHRDLRHCTGNTHTASGQKSYTCLKLCH